MYLKVEKKSYKTTITTNYIKTKQNKKNPKWSKKKKPKINKQRTTTKKTIKENEGRINT